MSTKSSIVWSQSTCTYCVSAKTLLESKGYTVEERKIDGGQWSKKDLLDAVPSARSVPQIFIGDKYIGGFNELVKYLQ